MAASDMNFSQNSVEQFDSELNMVPPIQQSGYEKDLSCSKEEAWTSAG